MMAVWFGLFTGLAEVGLLAVKKLVMHHIIHLSPHIVWMTPLANVTIFLVFGLVFFLLARFKPRLVSRRVVFFTYALVGFWGILFMYTQIHYLARIVLALGVAVQATRLVEKYPQYFYTLIRYTLGWMGGLKRRTQQAAPSTSVPTPPVPAASDYLPGRRQFLLTSGTTMAGLALGVHGWERIADRNAAAALPRATTGLPNVILIVLDTVRSASLGLQGYDRPTTPQMAQWIKEGVFFDRAIATAPWTLPSHASMFTGRWHHELTTDFRSPLDDTYPTLAEILSAHGYMTAGFVANTFYCGYEHGLDRGFAHYEDYMKSPGQVVASASWGRTLGCWNRQGPGCEIRPLLNYYDLLGRKNAQELTQDFSRWLSDRDDRPFFAFLNYFDAHAPYMPPPPYDTMFGEQLPRGNPMLLDSENFEWTPEQVQAEMNAYDGTIAYIDHYLGLLRTELEERGLLDNTLLIITSDHGEEFAEHGVMQHANSLYLPSVHVPLLLSFPSTLPENTRVSTPVTLRDLPSTVMELLGLDGPFQFPGASLSRHWTSAEAAAPEAATPLLSHLTGVDYRPDWYPVSKGDMHAAVLDRYRYILNGDGREELYDIVDDPWEKNDLAASESMRPVLERFRATFQPIVAA